MTPPKQTYTIGQVERDTGLSKDVLRVWERRYDFPLPLRDEQGERVYTGLQVDKLCVIKRLMDAGHRPGKLVPRSLKELREQAARLAPPAGVGSAPSGEFDAIIGALKSNDPGAMDAQLSQLLLRQGLREFVLSTLAPLNFAIGEAWLSGRLAIHEEHLYTERVQGVLRAAIRQMTSRAESPRVLLTTLPQEQHGLGLLMVEGLLAAADVSCVSLGTQVPVQDVVNAASAHRADVVALSFSSAFSLRGAMDGIESVREKLDPSTSIWVGGRLASRLKNVPPGVLRIDSLLGIAPAVQSWRESHPQTARPR